MQRTPEKSRDKWRRASVLQRIAYDDNYNSTSGLGQGIEYAEWVKIRTIYMQCHPKKYN